MKRGFSLIEVVIVVFIAAAFVLLFAGLLSRSREMGRTMSCVNNMKQIAQAIENYQSDWKDTPFSLTALSPTYIPNQKTFQCPLDRSGGNSYENFYVNRPLYEEESQKILLACPRHFGYTRTVAAYLSYAVDVGSNQKVTASGLPVSPAKFGQETYSGELKFADGTVASVSSGKAGILASFTDNHGRIYSIIFIPEGQAGEKTKVEVTHEGNSQFEVITPSVIAGVAGTRFSVATSWTEELTKTVVQVFEKKVKGVLRATGKLFTLEQGKSLVEETARWEDEGTSTTPDRDRRRRVPRKPPKPKHFY